MTIRGYLVVAILLAGGGGLAASAWIDWGYELAEAAAAAGTEEDPWAHFLWESLGICAYVLLLVAVLRWVLRRIAAPVGELTGAAEDAIEFGRRLEGDGKAPSEIRRLRRTLARLAGLMEDQVEARTRELSETAEALRAEIEERRRTEAELDEALRKAESAARAKGEFLSVVSHELRTPMHAVLGTMTLLGDSSLDESQRRLLASGQAAGSALLQLLNDLLDMSRIEAGQLQIETSEMRPESLLDTTAEVFHIAARNKGVLLTASIDPDVPAVVLGDPLRVRQVLLNLVGNAVKFTERGSVRMSVSMAAGAEGPGALRFTVTDTGPGISEADQTRLFAEFSQLDSSYARKYGGTGLGLAISRRLVEMMGGSIGICSSPGVGSEFHFTIPAAAVAGNDDAARLMEALAERRLAVVSDEPAWTAAVLSCLDPWTAQIVLPGAEGEPPVLAGADTLVYISMKPYEQAELACSKLRQACDDNTRLVGVLYPPAGTVPGRGEGLPFDAVIGGPLKARILLETAAGMTRHDRPAAAGPSADAVGAGGASILVVEDSEANRAIAAAILSRAGYQVRMASDGAAGVEAAREGGFDLVLMDLQMPVMDGIEAVHRIRELPGPPGRVPVVALTANVFARNSRRLVKAGFEGFLPKPIGRGQLLEAAAEWVKVGRLRREEDPATGMGSGGLTSSRQAAPKGPEGETE